MRRIRTIPEAVREIQAADPNTYFTEWKLRLMIKRGIFAPATVSTGTRVVLIDMDKLEALMDGQTLA